MQFQNKKEKKAKWRNNVIFVHKQNIKTQKHILKIFSIYQLN